MRNTRTAIPRTRPGGIDVASELRRLMPRDRWLLDLLHEHQVLTTEHIAALGFDHVHTARNRLAVLARRGILARFRDGVRPGSQQWRWTLGLLGAAYIAARDDRPPPAPAAVRQRIDRLAASPRLAHLLGVNGFFVGLAAQARTSPDADLSVWWSERSCRSITGDLIRPDGHGVWTDGGATCSFWLEYDTGSEATHRVVTKLDGYAALHAATGLTHAVLIHASSPRAEHTLHPRLARHPAVQSGQLLVATSNAQDPAGAAGPSWLPARPERPVTSQPAPKRLPLALLPATGTT